ncbi:extracellular solute-binding protein [Paenibacillus hamazuiensis]|uniref:extracellular solute-binding protein n=1 Tax=Paenibacillus hamazuiensis TaxID=2936508 RepID=UPI00200BD17D|nr:extracellular solute-binding protein [Paenibacillus hamazuiensis]
MSFRKFGSVSIGTMLAMGVLTACSGGNEDAAVPAPSPKGGTPASDQNQPSTAVSFPLKDPITIKMFAQRSAANGPYKDMLVFKEYEKMTNIKIEWQDVPNESFAEKKNLVFASNELPDAFYKAGIDPSESVKYGSSGILIPLEGLIAKHAPNINKLMTQYPEIKSSITAPDGHIYSLPAIITLKAALTQKNWINQAWLKKLNLKAPQTTDELLTVLRVFRDNDPNGNGQKDEIPMLESDLAALIGNFSGSFGLVSQMGYNLNIENGKVRAWFTDPKYKEELMFLNQIYKEKLIDPNTLTQTYAQFLGKIASGNVGYFHNQANDPFAKFKDDFVGISPLKGPHGDQLQSASPIARDFGVFAITSKNKHPEETMKWIDYFYGDKGSIFFRYGIEGQTFAYKQDGKPEYTDQILGDPRGSGIAIGQFTAWPGGGSPQWVNEINSSAINRPAVEEAEKQIDPYLPKQIYGAPLLDEATSKKLDTLRQDIDSYVNTNSAKFITGALSFDKWDEFVATLKKMNLDQVEKIYQDALDRNNKK